MLPTHRESVAAWLGCPAPDPTLGTPALQIRAGWPADAIGEPADETLQALRRLWSGAAEYAGRHVIVSGTLAILPVNNARLPIWVGGAVRRSAERAARLGDGCYGGINFRLFAVVPPDAGLSCRAARR